MRINNIKNIVSYIPISAVRTRAADLLDQSLYPLLPPRCARCGDALGAQDGLCGSCWKTISFLSAPLCELCAFPLSFNETYAQKTDCEHSNEDGKGEDAHLRCAACYSNPPPFAAGLAAVRYTDTSRALLLQLKYGDRTDLAGLFARWGQMALAQRPLATPIDICLPVPLHRARLRKRRFNQALLIARQLAKRNGWRLSVDGLIRHRPTKVQQGLTAAGRERNVSGAFRIRPKAADRFKGKHILLIDDVWTTGSTLRECARVLNRAGAKQVTALSIARVVTPEGQGDPWQNHGPDATD
ncbi:MAG: ComF family protein [Pseudomonadota bacterium]